MLGVAGHDTLGRAARPGGSTGRLDLARRWDGLDAEWHVLERDGRAVGRYQVYRSDPPTADLFEATGDLADAAAAIFAELGGWLVATADEALAAALLARGAELVRHSHVMSRPVSASEVPARWSQPWTLEPIDASARFGLEVVPLIRAAFPPGHPDEEKGSDAEIVGDVNDRVGGRRLGPLLEGSAVVRDDGRPVGLIVVNRVPGEPPFGGPWISDVCRDPDPRYRGLGRSLVEHALACGQASGEPALSLAVTVGNPAQRLYEGLGFVIAITSQKVRIPR